jgi:hypothetical protein
MGRQAHHMTINLGRWMWLDGPAPEVLKALKIIVIIVVLKVTLTLVAGAGIVKAAVYLPHMKQWVQSGALRAELPVKRIWAVARDEDE